MRILQQNFNFVYTFLKKCVKILKVISKRGEKRMEITQLGWFAFDGIADNAVIYVPAEAYEDYISNMGWSKYKEKIHPEE